MLIYYEVHCSGQRLAEKREKTMLTREYKMMCCLRPTNEMRVRRVGESYTIPQTHDLMHESRTRLSLTYPDVVKTCLWCCYNANTTLHVYQDFDNTLSVIILINQQPDKHWYYNLCPMACTMSNKTSNSSFAHLPWRIYLGACH